MVYVIYQWYMTIQKLLRGTTRQTVRLDGYLGLDEHHRPIPWGQTKKGHKIQAKGMLPTNKKRINQFDAELFVESIRGTVAHPKSNDKAYIMYFLFEGKKYCIVSHADGRVRVYVTHSNGLGVLVGKQNKSLSDAVKNVL